MNGENNHVFHTSALDSWPHDVQRPRLTWTLFAAQLWLLVAFVGMSLVAIAVLWPAPAHSAIAMNVS